MTADVIQLRDFARPARPAVTVAVQADDAEVIVLPVIRVERAVAECRKVRKSLLGDL